MALSPGTHLGPYEIVGMLGAGGMGEVYRARDPRLDREVAIKVLPEDVAHDSERLHRFEKEARAAGALNHPNILDVHDVGAHEGRPYLVTELLEGGTLRERMAAVPLSVEKAVEYAVQIARGLAAAHDKGIVHRDLKPENLFVTKDGLIKILDFGLAKLRGPQGQAAGMDSEGETASQTTDTGAVIGTAGYMSPEQVRGQAVDHRSDIFSFGAVLYEMLSGQRAFRGDSGVEVLNAILKKEPPEVAPRGSPEIPRSFLRILKRCLEKSPEQRFQSVPDLIFDLEGVLVEPGVGSSEISLLQAAHPTHLRKASWAGLGLLLGIVVGGAGIWALSRRSEPSQPVVRMRMGVDPAERLGGGEVTEASHFGLQRPSRTDLALSPVGDTLVFTGVKDDKWQLYRRRMDEFEASPIPGTEMGMNPFFSPDGEWVGFWSGPDVDGPGELQKVPLSEGLPVTLCETATAPMGAAWGPDDHIILGMGWGSLLRVSASGGTPEEFLTLEDGERGRLPQVLPGGEAVLFSSFMSGSWRIVLYVLATGERRVLLEGGADARYVPTGHLVYAREGTLVAAPFDLHRLKVTGDSIPVVEGVMQAMNAPTGSFRTGAGQFSTSRSGTLVYVEGGAYPAAAAMDSLVWVDREGTVEPVGAPPMPHFGARLSPDDQRVLLLMTPLGSTSPHLAVFDIARRTLTRLTHEGRASGLVWTPDGQGVIFANDVGGETSLCRLAADGSGESERLAALEPAAEVVPSSVSSDGQELALAGRGGDLYALTLAGGEGRLRPIPETRFREMHPELSPDGRWLAYTSDESGRMEVYVRRHPGPGPRTRISVDGGQAPAWRGDGRELFYVRREVGRRAPNGVEMTSLFAVDITTDPALTPGVPRKLFEGPYDRFVPVRGYDVTADGRRFLMSTPVVLPVQPATHINVVLNWFEELKRRVPVD